MEVAELFGDLRSLMQRRPTARVWQAVCTEIDVWTPDEIEQFVLAYASGLSRRWPDARRVSPTRWLLWAIQGVRVPQLDIVRSLDMELSAQGFALDDANMAALASLADLRRVSILSLRSQRRAVDALEVFAKAHWFSSVRDLSFAYAELFDAHVDRMIRAGALERIERVDVSFTSLGRRGVRELTKAAPKLEELVLRGVELMDASDLWDAPRGAITRLDARECFADPDGVLDELVESDWAQHLEQLAFASVDTSAEELARACSAKELTSLTHLSLNGCTRFDASVAQAIVGGPLAERLVALDVRQGWGATNARYGRQGAASLVHAESMRSLERLALSGGASGWSWGELLGRAGALEHTRLRGLVVENAKLDAAQLERMLARTWAEGLEELELRGNPLGADGARVIARSRVASRLRKLSLNHCNVSQEALVELAQCEALAGLDVLDVRGNSLGARANSALSGSETLAQTDILGVTG